MLSRNMKKLNTWAGRSDFKYEGSIPKGTTIYFGTVNSVEVSAIKYQELINHFRGLSVNIGTSRTDAPIGSVGAWLQENVTKTAIASYVGAILIEEGFAEKSGKNSIINFKKVYPI